MDWLVYFFKIWLLFLFFFFFWLFVCWVFFVFCFTNRDWKQKIIAKLRFTIFTIVICRCPPCTSKIAEWNFILDCMSFCLFTGKHCCIFLELHNTAAKTEGTLIGVLGYRAFMVFKNNWEQNLHLQKAGTKWTTPSPGMQYCQEQT